MIARTTTTPAPTHLPPRLPRRRLHFIRFIALFAALMALGGIGASVYAYVQIGRAERIVRDQLRVSGDTFAQIADSLQTTSDSALHAAGTIDAARVSLSDAAGTTRTLATTLDDTGKAINVTIPGFGVRPFGGVESNFHTQASQFRDLATTVDHTRDALSQNGADLRAVGTNVSALATTVRGRANDLHALAGPNSTLAGITTPMRVLALWSMVMHLLLLGVGVSLFLLTTGHHHIVLAVDGDEA